MKKVLALVVAFALCFTVFAGCFATSAAALDNFAVSSVEVAADAQAAAVTVSGTYTGKAVQLLTVTLPAGVALDSVEGAKELTDTQDGDYIVTKDNVVKFLTIPKNAFTYILKVTFAANTSETDAVAYEVAADVEYALYDAETPVIEYANAKGTITVAKKAPEHTCATVNYKDNGDGTHDGVCDCEDATVVIDNEAHSYTDGVCVCGAVEEVVPEEPVVDPSLTFASVSLGYGTSSLQMSFRVNNTILDSYADMELVIVPQKYDLTTLNLVETPSEIVVKKADLAKAGSTRKQYIHTDIYLYELGLNIDYMLRAYDAEGNLVAISETFTTSAATFLKSTYTGSSDAKLRTLIADTLVVGDEAMKNTAASYKNSDLAAASSIIEGFDTSEATQTVGEYNTINQFNSYDDEYTTASTAVHQVRTSVQIGKVPFINFRIADNDKVLDFEKLVVTVSYTSKDSSGEHPYSRDFTGSDFTYAGKYINCKFDEVGLHDSDKDILFTVKYDGETVSDLTYSIETYLGSMTSNASVGALTTALIKLGQSFRSYQGL